MLDTMTFTKAAAGLCGALLVFLLGSWAADELYEVESHGEQSYVIDTGAEEAAEEEQVAEVSFEEVYASADPEAGARIFRRCSACHVIEDGVNGTGPHLYNVVGRDIASIDAFSYSDALAGKEGDWTPETLSAFIENPRGWAPGTTMGFAGLDDIEDRANVIAYIEQQSGG